MSYRLMLPPASEPISLADAKEWLKIDGQDEDKLLSALLTAARLAVEAVTGLMLITQTWRLTLDQWPQSGALVLTHAPLQALSAFRLRDADGIMRELPLSDLDIVLGREPRIQPRSPAVLPAKQIGGIEIDCLFGYGADGNAVPDQIKLAIKMLVAFWHENRGDDANGTALRWPEAVSALLYPYMLRRL